MELKLLHMVTGDPKRTPTLVAVRQRRLLAEQRPGRAAATSCVSEPTGSDAWNHGDVGAADQHHLARAWSGPACAPRASNNSIWSDHTDIQPTMMALLGLRDDYMPDGRVLGEISTRPPLPPGMRAHRGTLLRLGRVYTQLEAAVGPFGLDTLRASTRALASNSPGDATYTRIENQLQRSARPATRSPRGCKPGCSARRSAASRSTSGKPTRSSGRPRPARHGGLR